MDKESAQLMKIVLFGFVVILVFLFWVALKEAANLHGTLLGGPALAALSGVLV
jgi:hypothetical protein